MRGKQNMADETRDDGPNPPFVIGAPVPPPSHEECMAWNARQGTLVSYLLSIGAKRDYAFEREGRCDGGREP
jgi:hypothetical protein